MKTVTNHTWSEFQIAEYNRVMEAAANDDPEAVEKLLRWALARITFYGPTFEPAAECIRKFLAKDFRKVG